MKRLIVSAGLALAVVGCASAPTALPPAQAASVPRQASWMLPQASQTNSLLYVSTSSNGVQIYNYSKGVVGTLFGQISVYEPGGMCTDKAGDVWITSKHGTVTEYGHGSSTPLRALPGEHATPYACAIDPTSGNLAVSYNRPDRKYGAVGIVRVFGKSDANKKYSGFSDAWFLAYDNKGDLFVDGWPCYGCTTGSGFQGTFELANGGPYFEQLDLQGATFRQPTGMAWINPTLLVADSGDGYQQPAGYKLLVHGNKATVVSTLVFSSAQSVGGLTFRASSILVPDTVGNILWAYDLSGNLESSFRVIAPVAAVVSQK
jgi:hypothetical protein